MKKRNGLLLLGALLASASLVACSSSMNTKGKGMAQLMYDNQERVFYEVHDDNNDKIPGKDEKIARVYITKGGKATGYNTEKLKMDDVIGKSIDEVRKLAEEKSERTFENDKIIVEAITDGSGNNIVKERIKLFVTRDNEKWSNLFDSLTSGQIRDKYYAGYVDSDYLLITEVAKGNVINFDKIDGKIVVEGKK